MELDRIQLDENGGLIPTLKGGVQTFQDIADTSQNNINALPDTGVQGFLKGTAQVPQDFFNVIAHPVKTAQESYEYYKENPKMLLPLNQVFDYQNQKTQELLEGNYNPSKELGSLAGGILSGLALGGLGNKAIPAKSTTNLPIRRSLGGDALTVTPAKRGLGFETYLLSQGGVPLSDARQNLARAIRRNTELGQNKLGSYNTIRSNINISPNSNIQNQGRSAYDTGMHEGAHYALKRLEALENVGYATPETSRLLYDLKQSQSNKLTPLAENEAISRAFEQLRNPNIRFSPTELESLMINPDDITNAYKVLQPYWKSYRGGI